MNLDELPDEPMDRLIMYQLERHREEAHLPEHLLVGYIRLKKDIGLTLTAREERILAYSPFGTAAGCGY